MSAPERIRKVVIVGGGVDGWTTAAGLAQAFQGQDLEIRLMARETADPVTASRTAPVSQVFHQRLGIEEPALMRACQATFNLGTLFKSWVQDGHEYIQPIGPHGASIEFVHFHQFASKARAAGDTTPFNDYSLCAVAARAGRFTHPSADRNSILSTLFYAHHLDTQAYAELMRDAARRLGVSEAGGEIRDVERDERGFIEALRLDDGSMLEAELFIDCSGPDAVLMSRLGVEREDWRSLLPADRVVSARGPAGNLAPMGIVTGLDQGWHQALPLQDSTGHSIVFLEDTWDDEAAVSALREAAGGELESGPALTPLTAGRSADGWSGNCVALGAASVQIPPLDASHLALLHTGIMRLVTLFPDRNCNPEIAAEFNEVSGAEHRNIRDFLLLHYLGVRRDSPFWQAHRPEDLPESLAYKIRLFREQGQVAFYEEESYPDTSWVSVWLGQDQWPKSHDPVLDKYDFKRLQARFLNMRDIIAQAVNAMPPHEEYLRRYCAPR